jgi:cytochrome d ubiquinol oxidase subunit II
MVDLNSLWFVLIAVLWIGFYFLEGFDLGVGMLLPFLGRKDEERRAIINAIGPHWDGNEVWLLTAGGATFAAFPQWYATMFSGFYLALFLLLVALILRGVSFEFRSKDANPRWRHMWDWCIFAGSFLTALLLGVAFANLAKGVPIDANMQYTGNLFTLLNWYGLLGGLATVTTFLLHGANFLSLKMSGELQERARSMAKRLFPLNLVVMFLLLLGTYIATDIYSRLGLNPGLVPLIGLGSLLAAGYFISKRHDGWAFVMVGLNIVFVLVTLFMILYPRVMISSTNPLNSLTIYNAASSPYTLKVMTIVALVFVPIVLMYQGWTYYVFRRRISTDVKTLTY